jgi:putative ABC transport system permease protein
MHRLDWIRVSLRQCRHFPLYSFAVAGSLALAIAATGAAFAVVKRAFLDPLPYDNAGRVIEVLTDLGDRMSSVSFFVSEDLRQSPLLSDVSAARFATVTYEAPEAAERLNALEVTRSYFNVLGARPAVGALWPAGTTNAAIVSWGFYQRALGGDPAAVGRQVMVDGVPRTIAAVMPESFASPFDLSTAMWLPLNTDQLLADTARARRTVTVLALMAPGTTFQEVSAFLQVFSEGQRTRFPDIHGRERWVATPLRTAMLNVAMTSLRGTAGAAFLLLIIVWANIAGLSAAQAVALHRSNAVRAVLGATGPRLFAERLRDNVVLAALGTTAGLWLADTLTTIASRYQQQFLANMRPVTFDLTTAAFGIGVGAITAVIGALFSHRSTRRLTAPEMLAGRGAAAAPGMSRIRSVLVVVQVAVAIVLLVSGGLLVRTVRNLAAADVGFDTEYLSTFTVNLPPSRYQGTPRHLQFERDVLERLRNLPGVRDVTASVGFPAAGAMGARLTILQRPDRSAPPELTYLSVAPGFFSFLGLPVIEGRDIAVTDDFEAPRVVVINQTMARTFWPAGDAIGAKVKIGAGAPSDREITVVGIVPDVLQHGLTQLVRPTAYGSTLQYSWPRRHISVKTDQPIATLAADVRGAIRAVDPLMAIPTLLAFDEQLSLQTARHRLVMFVLGVFGTVATVLCGFGLYAVVALTAQYRRREFAIRLALGARSREVLWLVFRQSVILGSIGAVAGLFGAAVTTKTLAGMLHGVEPTDHATFAAAVIAILILATAASLLPALRAGRIDPAETLKSQ